MSHINEDSLLDTLDAWEKSEKGQKVLQKTLDGYVSKGKDKTDAGSRVITRKAMAAASKQLIQTLKDIAKGYGLPESVIAHFDSLTASKPVKMDDGSYRIEIRFTDDLSRQSLRPEDYEGVRNIIAIFNNGYPSDRSRQKAISYIEGWWHGRNTKALPYRAGLYFMQDAVYDFNTHYGWKELHAEVGEEYDRE